MLGSMFEGLLQILFRVWTLGVFYFLNNRLFSWMKDSRTPKIPYQKIPQSTSQEERIFSHYKDNDSGHCLFKSNNISWKNLIFMNLANSKNQSFSHSGMTTMFPPYQKKQLLFSNNYCIKDNISNSNLLISWGIDSEQSPEDIGDSIPQTYSESYCSDLVPFHCFARNFKFTKPCVYEDCFCEDIMQKERAKHEQMEYFKKQECLMHCGLEKSFYKNHCCMEKDREKLTQMEQLNKEEFMFPKEMYCSLENAIYKDFLSDNFMQTEKQDKMGDLIREECLFPKGKHCSSAASIDSGFQSFHSINTTYTCLDVGGITLYISNIHHNKVGKIIAMTVGFGVAEDSSEESIFSDEEDSEDDSDNEDLSEDEDGFECCDSDEDFIVFDTAGEQCPITEQFCPDSMDGITVAVNFNAPCPTFEVQISQTVSPKPNYFCHVKVDEFERKCKLKKNRKFNFENDVQFEQDKTKTAPETCSAGAAGARRVKINMDVEVHKIVMWEYAYRQARLGPWKDFATDRLHFQRRIEEVGKVVEPVLMKKLAKIA